VPELQSKSLTLPFVLYRSNLFCPGDVSGLGVVCSGRGDRAMTTSRITTGRGKFWWVETPSLVVMSEPTPWAFVVSRPLSQLVCGVSHHNDSVVASTDLARDNVPERQYV
jgi:hypothetical protein